MNNYRCGDPNQPVRAARSCVCAPDGDLRPLPEHPVAAMAYVPFQQSDEVFEPEQALRRGTAFPVLHKPFLAGCLQ